MQSISNIILTTLSQNGKGFTKEYAEWYLALSYLKDNDINKGRVLLQKVHAQISHKYYKEAGEVLEQL